MSNIDKVSVKGEFFNIVSPSAFGDYIETIGGACTNPSGYAKDRIFLAKTNDVQNLYKATQAISFGANIVVGTNCEKTSLSEVIATSGGASSADQVSYDNSTSGLTADDVQEAIDEVNGKTNTNANNISSLNSALTNKAYLTDDTTETTLASDDVLPFYDTSATAKRKMTVDKFVGQTVSNPNLLDNPWLTVNQRGQTSYTNVNTPTLDRIYIRVTTQIDIISGGIRVTNLRSDGPSWFGQRMPYDDMQKLLGKTLTASLLTTDGEIISWSFILDSNAANSDVYTTQGGVDFNFRREWSGTSYFLFNIWIQDHNDYLDVRAIKLELGSVSTLAMDTEPNYATELLKCQRYYVRLNSNNGSLVTGMCINSNSHSNRFALSLPTVMRTTPTLSYSNLSDFKVTRSDGASGVVPTAINKLGSQFGTIMAVEFIATGASAGEPVVLYTVNNTGYLNFSADL